MLKTTLLFISLASFITAMAQPQDSEREKQAIQYAIEEMAGAFGSSEIDRYLQYWTYPCAYQFDGGLSSFENEEKFGSFISSFRQSLPEKYSRSMIAGISIEIVDDTQAMASVMWVRIVDGKPTENFGDVYTLVRKNGEWKVILAVAYGGERLIALNK